MSLTDKDCNFEMEHVVTKSICREMIVNGEPHEFVFDLIATYDLDGALLNVDTKFWAHYVFTDETGYQKLSGGDFPEEMPPDVEQVFKSIESEF